MDLSFLRKPLIQKLFGTVVLITLYVFLYKLLIPRLTAFGCFDDCFNFLGGYFLLHNKKLFSEIFYNHAPFMAYISMLIQWITHPENLFDLILRHRQFLLFFGLVSEILLLFRFGFLLIPFAIAYELTKFYLFGDRFLAESFIVYPFFYLLGLFVEKYFNKTLSLLDYILVGVSTWFILFMREPYAVTVLFVFVYLLLGRWSRGKWIGIGIFLSLFVATMLTHSIPELIFNVFTVNVSHIQSENQATGFLGLNIYKSFLYPLVIFFSGNWNFFHEVELLLASAFLLVSGYFLYKNQWKLVLLLWITLGLTNLRQVDPGKTFYGSFHLLPWYALTLFSSVFLTSKIWSTNKRLTIVLWCIFCAIIALVLFSKESYIHDTVDEHTEYITNYGRELQVGNVVNALSTPKNTLFLDGFDDDIYFVAKRYSPYKYSWYTSLMPSVAKYTDARLVMFKNTPPDFYYGSCPKQKSPNYLLPDFAVNEYVRLFNIKDPSCLWIRKSILPHISSAQWTRAGEQLYYLSPHTN